MKSFKALLTKDVTSFFVRRFSSFTYLNVTQFLGALNDNVYKLLIVFFFIHLDGIANSEIILAITGAVFVLPFLLFSASSGILADRFSKRNIIVLTKALELVIMLAGVLSFAFESRLGGYCTLFLMATQSAIFAPSKYGIIPEIVEEDKITKANGLLTSFTFLAIILGTFLASFLLDISGRNFVFASIFCTTLSVIGLATSFCIQYTPPSGFQKRFNILFLNEIYKTLKIAYTIPSLIAAIFGSAFFLFLGAFVQLNIIPYAVNTLHFTDIQGGYLFLLTAMGIGIGSLAAGKISGRTAELALVPLAGIGITLCCYMMDLFAPYLYFVLLLVFLEGMFGGIYEVPLDSYIQTSSPNTYRGQIIATTNFFCYFGALLASVMLYIFSSVFGFDARKGFAVMGTITLTVTIIIMFQFFDYLCRFIGMLLSRLHFRTVFKGVDIIPDAPAIYICTHTAWNDTLLLLGAQRRRMRFYIEQEQGHHPWLVRMYKILKVVNIPSIEPLRHNEECLTEIRKTLQRGISVCIFFENADICAEFNKLMRSPTFNKILGGLSNAVIPVSIEKSVKDQKPHLFERWLEKVHVPAQISFGPLVCSAAAVPAEDS